jgi:hypothetical protein
MITAAARAANGKTFRMDTAVNVEYYPLLAKQVAGMSDAYGNSRVKPIQPIKISRQQIDQWRVAAAGFDARIVHCLDRAKVSTVGELRSWDDKRLLALRSFGIWSLQNVRWFFRWTGRLEKGQSGVTDLRQWLRAFLNDQEIPMLELRFGLNDPLFRPSMRRMTLQKIADQLGGVTRERARQVEEAGLTMLRSQLARAVAAPLETYLVERIKADGGVVSSKDLSDWRRDTMFGGYQPWGALLLLGSTLERIHARHGCFCCLPSGTVQGLETAVLRVLREARAPVPFEVIRTQVAAQTHNIGGAINRERLLRIILDYHPEIHGTMDGRYFLPKHGPETLVVEILQAAPEPLHYYEIAHRYNEMVQPSSSRGTGFILHLVRTMPAVQPVGHGRYKQRAA